MSLHLRTLYHKVFDDTMKCAALVAKTFLKFKVDRKNKMVKVAVTTQHLMSSKSNKVLDSFWNSFSKEANNYPSLSLSANSDVKKYLAIVKTHS